MLLLIVSAKALHTFLYTSGRSVICARLVTELTEKLVP